MSHLSTTFSTPLFPIIAHFSCPSTDNLKTREQRPPKLAFKSSNPNTADRPRLGLEYVSMHSRESDSGQLNRYSLGAEEDPLLEFFRGNVFTSNEDDAPFSNANDVHERTTFFSFPFSRAGVRVSGMEAFSAALLLRLHVSKKKLGKFGTKCRIKNPTFTRWQTTTATTFTFGTTWCDALFVGAF